jgi:hypothetical protein
MQTAQHFFRSAVTPSLRSLPFILRPSRTLRFPQRARLRSRAQPARTRRSLHRTTTHLAGADLPGPVLVMIGHTLDRAAGHRAAGRLVSHRSDRDNYQGRSDHGGTSWLSVPLPLALLSAEDFALIFVRLRWPTWRRLDPSSFRSASPFVAKSLCCVLAR